MQRSVVTTLSLDCIHETSDRSARSPLTLLIVNIYRVISESLIIEQHFADNNRRRYADMHGLIVAVMRVTKCLFMYHILWINAHR